ncbi:vacuolar protein sorting-associated protein 13 [Mycena floridula]|nr:vacuolar protein sorting-associated protein 13 [Mycena floridula]
MFFFVDPGKEVLNVIFNRILAPYVENLDMNQVNYGIGQGQLTLRNLRMKKGALDKFRLPVDVLEGHLGTFTLSLHWMNLGNQPVEVLIEDVYLLVVPSIQTAYNAKEEEERAQANKAERLESAELLHMRGQAESTSDSPQPQGLWESLTAKIINNLQVTVKNIHIRYEDKMSVPGHPFAAGLTLAGFTAVSVNEKWQPTFIESTAGAIHKLGNLQSLAVYFDTDSPSMAGLPQAEFIKRFHSNISHNREDGNHQFVLKPVSGEGRIIMNHKPDKQNPRFDVQLLFDEIGVSLDDNQYRDAISLLDMYHVYARQQEYRKYRPIEEEFTINAAQSRLRFAGTAILEGVKQRRRQWSWPYFAERRDDRVKYLDLFQKKQLNTIPSSDIKVLEALERKLSYEDIRFYRSIARSRLGKDAALRKRAEEEKAKQKPAQQGWSSWLWGSSQNDSKAEDPAFGGPMTEEQRKQLYDVLDYDEKTAVLDGIRAPQDTLKARVNAKLNKGSFALRTNPRLDAHDILSIEFDLFQANVVQRADSLEASASLTAFSVFDGTTPGSLHPQIVKVKSTLPQPGTEKTEEEPFLFVKFEQKPSDGRADTGFTLKMRHLEIVYHKGYVEEIAKFFKPPTSQLESVEALWSVASQTFEDISKETRLGLEHSIMKRKTIDIQMDLNAPIIIIPEDVTTHNCKHLILDAGHLSIVSQLADKDKLRDLLRKGDPDVELLVYDTLSLKLKAAQFILGNDLQSCLDALTSDGSDSLHLLERTNIALEVQNSVEPTFINRPRFKISGNLPRLQVNMSDTKYKALMRLIDIAIPKLADDSPAPMARDTGEFSRRAQIEYHVEDDEEGSHEEFFDTIESPALGQPIFTLLFEVDELRATLSKCGADGVERVLGDVLFEHFALTFNLRKLEMDVKVNLRSLSVSLIQPETDQRMKFMTSISDSLSDENLLVAVTYTRKQSEGVVDQNVDIVMSTFVFRASPEPVITLYDFIMTTFVPPSSPDTNQDQQALQSSDSTVSEVQNENKIHVSVRLESVQVVLINDKLEIATLSLSTAVVSVLLRAKTLRVDGRLSSLALANETGTYSLCDEFQQIMSIEGDNFAQFSYQTFDTTGKDSVKSSVSLSAASIKFHFLEQPLHDMYLFLVKLAKLKGLYDAATQVAVQRASEIERMVFNISVKSPIVVFPSNPSHSRDALVLRLGEISANNTFDGPRNKISAGLKGIQLVSNLYLQEQLSTLKIVDDIEVNAKVDQINDVDRSRDTQVPDMQIAVHISDVRLHLTQVQYGLVVQLSSSIPRVLSGGPPENTDKSVSTQAEKQPSASTVALEPELRVISSAGSRSWTTMDLVVTVDTVKLHLYDESATTVANLKDHGIARFALNAISLRFKMLSDGAGEAQVVVRSLTMSNTRPGNSKYRDIIPVAQHDRNQFMLLYTMSGGSDKSALAVVTVDLPQVIFAVDPIFALSDFFTSAFPTSSIQAVDDSLPSDDAEVPTSSVLDFRVDLHNLSVSVLEDDTNSDSQSITLTVDQMLLSQQGILALTVSRLGMSLTRMGTPSDSVRFLDDVDLTFSLDSRSTSSQKMTSIEFTSKPITFRASYRDINLITAIVNKALELSSRRQNIQESSTAVIAPSSGTSDIRVRSQGSVSRPRPVGKARVLTSKEQLKASFDGFRLVLIGDMYEQPMVHLKVKRFIVGAKDWSGELHATTTLSTQISYWNLTNSHWEPFIDPWTLTMSIAKSGPTGPLEIKLSSRERLDLNLSTTFGEMAITSARMWGKEGERVLQNARGSYAPYRIRNRTGTPIFIWSDLDGSGNSKDQTGVTIANDQTIDWRFDDWKTMREHVSSTSGQHNVGVEFSGKPWEQLRSVPVDREGEFVFPLRPRMDKHSNRLLCEVRVIDNVKVVTMRSTYKVENQTLYPLEITLVDDSGHPLYSMEKVAPGQDYSLPIEAVTGSKIRIQPDQGFGYKWCSSIRWDDLISRKGFTIKCPHSDPKEAAFRFQAWVQTDLNANDSTSRHPKINLKLRAPLELENLLPYNLQYRVYDKNTDQNWKSYLRKGGVMPVHSVELGHLVLLNVEVQDTIFKPGDFAIINTDGNSDFDIEHRLTLRDLHDRKLNLKLNYIRYPDSGGAFKVQIYAPYLVINKTGLPFAIRTARSTRSSQDVAGDDQPDVLSEPIPFMLSHTSETGHEFVLKIDDSGWSKTFSVEAPSAETALVIPSQTQKSDEIHVGLTWTEGLGKYKLTKVITLAPRFMLKNNLHEALSFREHGVAPRDKSVVAPGERCPLISLRTGPEKLLTVALPGLNAQWSPPINMEDIGTVHLRLKTPGAENVRLIRADVQIDGSTIFVSFAAADDHWPFLVENDSDHNVTFSQDDATRDQQNRPGKVAVYAVAPHSTTAYAWDWPANRDKKLLISIKGSHRRVDVMEIGDLVPFNFKEGQRSLAVSLDVRAEGQKQVLRITNYNADLSLYKPKHRSSTLSGSTPKPDSTNSSVEVYEAVTDEVPPTMSFSVDFAGIGISLVNRKLIEVLYISMDTLSIEYSNTPVAQSVTVSCGTLQIDNQLHDAIFPVILQPTPIAKDSKSVAALPTVQASVIWLKDQEHGVLFVKYCSILLQALTIEADEDLLFSIYDLTQIQGASWEDPSEDVLIQHPDEIPEPVAAKAGQDLYFEVLELQPIRLSLSFMRTERVSSEEKLSLRNPLAVVLNALTMTVGNINDAPLEMNALGIKDMRLTMPELQSRIAYHYRQDVLRQLYRILGSADFIGNPVGLFTNVSSGVADIFYEPFNGVVMHGNKELGIGIAKGAASFVKKTVFGVSDSLTKFTSSVGKGLSAATFDSEYQARRRMTQRRNKPRHAIYGFTAGGEALASSMASAMEGVLIKPIEGAESEGAFGFFKGVGKGIVGAVTKPVVGVFDLASNVSEGIRNTTTVFDSPERDRVRFPRLVPADGVLRPYSAREATGQYWMRDLNNGAYRRESYVAHINTPGSDNVVLLTSGMIISFWSKKLKLEWELLFTQVQGVTVEDTGIRFAHKAGKEHDKFIFIPDKASQSWFFDRVAGVVKTFNIRRRMDTQN